MDGYRGRKHRPLSEHPPITWLLPVRNGMPFLPFTLQSIVDQTYRNHMVLAWDNGSTDGTVEELTRWIPARTPGRVVFDRPLSLGGSMASMVDAAETDLCAIIHGDDISLPQRLERQAEFLSVHPEVGILGSQVEILDDRGNVRHVQEWEYPVDDAEIRWLSRWQVRLCHPAVMFRRKAVLNAGNYRDCAPIEDADLWIRAASVCEIRNLPEVLLHYRRTQVSQTGIVTDWIPLNRRAARMNATVLFPNIANPKTAMDLWEVTHPVLSAVSLPVKPVHLRRLERAAALLALKVGKPENYFKNTSAYRAQQYHLRRRLMENLGLDPLFKMKQALKARKTR